MESEQISTLEPMLTVRQVAALLQVSPNTVYNWVSQQRLKAHRFGPGPRGSIRFKLADISNAMRELSALNPLVQKGVN